MMPRLRGSLALICVTSSLLFGPACSIADIEAQLGRPLTALEASGHPERSNGNHRELGHQMVVARWGETAWPCLDYVIMHESAWRNVPNANGGRAYGIPQALPGSKMSTAGADWRTNPATQIRWLLDYVEGRYGSTCAAKRHKVATGWY